MISKYFEVKVRYNRIAPDGKEITVSEPYLIDAVSFTDTEASIHKELEPYISGEFEVRGEKISEFAELIADENGDRWFKSRIIFMAFDEDSGKTKETGIWVLVQANTVKEAYESIIKQFEDTVSEYRIKAISESPIVDVFASLEKDDLPTEAEPVEEYPFPEDEKTSPQ